jgi:acyl-CoA reductase-like NAD-dependent aldehyde dehydrogenase
MNSQRQRLAETITNEMGKCIKESYGEVDKSIAMIDYAIKNAEKFMTEEEIPPSKYARATVVQQPWGPSLSKR